MPALPSSINRLPISSYVLKVEHWLFNRILADQVEKRVFALYLRQPAQVAVAP
jgi:hypothetical protein